MELPSRAKPSPGGTSGAMKSATSKKCSRCLRDHHHAAATTPNRPPWKLIPPSQILNRSEEHTSELQSLMRISYAVFCLKKKKTTTHNPHITHITTTSPNSYKLKIQP